MKAFITSGFKAEVIAPDNEFSDEKWLGRGVDMALIEELKNKGKIDLCGETGDYHTFVYDGPVFKKPVDFRVREKAARDKHRLLILE